MAAPIPGNEAQRLEALRDYHILDTVGEQSYDDITTLAAQICGVPIAMVSLVDKDRQWFKSKVGLTQTETPRDIAFCAHAILGREPLVVRDALKDERFANNPLVTGEPHIRFYFGVPLINQEGFALGTFCVIDRKPQHLTDEQQRAMKALARQIVALLEMRRVLANLEAALEQVKTLKSLLPICAWCKRIRNDEGYWQQVEIYLSAQMGTDFTHHICPDCLEKERAKKAQSTKK
jgi:GAF domain-containing protein